MSKPFAAFDVDGTIFKSSLAEKVVDGCIAANIFSAESFNEVFTSKRRWQENNNEGAYQAYLHRLVGAFVSQMAGIEVEKFNQVTATMIEKHAARKFAFSRRLVHALRASHHPIAISGSPDMLVRPFLADIGIVNTYGSSFEIEDGKFTGNAASVGDKATVLRNLVAEGVVKQEGSIAVGDTFSDIPMLEYVDFPIMFNASRTLTDYGKEFGWTRAHEVKDQITILKHNADLGAYVEQDTESFIDSLRE